jgi:hypothetical protein
MAINPNMFAMETVQGQIDLSFHSSVITCEVSSSQATALLPGQAVKLEDSAGGLPKVLALATNADPSFGVVLRNLKDINFPAMARVEVALAGSVVYMTAGAAIARGAKVEFVNSTLKVITAAGTNPVLGFALDKAAGDNSLVRVYILTPAVTSAETIADIAGLQDALDALEADVDAQFTALVDVATLAQINSGKVLLAVPTGKKAIVSQVIGRVSGTFAALDSVEINVGAAVVASFAVADLSNGAVLMTGDGDVSLGAAFGLAGADGADITVSKTGSEGTTATNITFTITYSLIPA